MAPRLTSFNLPPGRKLGSRYVVETLLGVGSEGEVYEIREVDTGIRRAAKLYFPHRDPRRRTIIRHAQKLDTLRYCPIVLQYHHSHEVIVRGQKVLAMVSELCKGDQLERWIARHRGGRLSPFEALHVLYALAQGLEAVHSLGEYHADVHSQNILIHPVGVRFELKLLDFYDWGKPTRWKQQHDIVDCIRVFVECMGGRTHYGKLPKEIRYIACNLRYNTIIRRFPTMSALRRHLERFEWEVLE
nr:MAG: serine/threonine protein kinase [Pseudomonadota bacterium]